MGQAKQKRLRSESIDISDVERVGDAIRRLATAASEKIGYDCYVHALIGKELLADFSIDAEVAAGYAAWRTGESDGSVIAHTSKVKGYLPPGAQGFAYHAWLVCGTTIIDLTTYQIPRKAAELDAMDGGHTELDWAPALLIADFADVKGYAAVRQGSAGMFYYERDRRIEKILAETSILDPEDVAHARLVLRNPNLMVIGPNDIAQTIFPKE